MVEIKIRTDVTVGYQTYPLIYSRHSVFKERISTKFRESEPFLASPNLWIVSPRFQEYVRCQICPLLPTSINPTALLSKSNSISCLLCCGFRTARLCSECSSSWGGGGVNPWKRESRGMFPRYFCERPCLTGAHYRWRIRLWQCKKMTNSNPRARYPFHDLICQLLSYLVGITGEVFCRDIHDICKILCQV